MYDDSKGINRAQFKYFGAELNEMEKNTATLQIEGLLDTLNDAKEYGSILNVDGYAWDLLRRFVNSTNTDGQIYFYTYRLDYWLFDSGKKNGFKVLIYMYRYNSDAVGRVRTDYLHKAQKYLETAMQGAQYTLENACSYSEKCKATKAITKYTKQLAEMKIYDEAIENQRIEIDLDDGVKVNYVKFQGVEVA